MFHSFRTTDAYEDLQPSRSCCFPIAFSIFREVQGSLNVLVGCLLKILLKVDISPIDSE